MYLAEDSLRYMFLLQTLAHSSQSLKQDERGQGSKAVSRRSSGWVSRHSACALLLLAETLIGAGNRLKAKCGNSPLPQAGH